MIATASWNTPWAISTLEVVAVQVRRLTWLGTRTQRYDETKDFFGRVLGLPLVAEEPGLAMFQLPGGEHDYVEVFDVAQPEASFMTTGPVAGFLVDDVVRAREELEAEGIEMLGEVEWLRDVPEFEAVPDYGWFTFRGPDGNVYNCTQGSWAIAEPAEGSAVHSSRPSVEGVMAAVDAFNAALRSRDLIAAEAVWALDKPDVSILGSASGEEFIGPDAVRTCLAALTSRQTAHGWRWVDRQVSVVGDVAWMMADAPWQTVHPDGAVSERPYRVTGVLVLVDGAWRWCQYHGSEPLGSTG